MKIIDKDEVLPKYLKLPRCLKVDHINTVCCNCRNSDTLIRPNGRPLWRVCVCKKDNCTGYLCHKCYCKNRYDDVIKPMRKYSMGKINIYENNGMGLLGECVVARYFGIRDCTDCDILWT